MASIFNIQQDLYSIFDSIEENEGEITPELEKALTIKREEFSTKIQGYVAFIKQLELDNKGIKEEIARLKDLQKSKEKTIDNLKKIMAMAINAFGDTNKSGTKFLDYGTGKVSIRKSDSIEVDEEGTKQFVNRFFRYFNWLHFTNTADQQELDVKDIIDFCNKNKQDDEEDIVETNYTDDDLTNLQANLDFKVNLKDLITNPNGLKLINSLLDYKVLATIKPSVDKTEVKKEVKSNGEIPTFAKYVIKDNVIIK
nr:MAG: hypothetical protein [Bacteriophage sp.]